MSIWDDEAHTYWNTHSLISDVFSRSSEANAVHPPLYFIVIHYWMIIFGDSATSMRLPSLIFGLITIFFVYKLGTLLSNKTVGLLASLLIAISVCHIQHLQDARPYSLFAFLTTLSFFFYINLVSKKSISIMAGYIVSSSLMLYTHFFSFFILLGQNIISIYTIYFSDDKKTNIRKWITSQIILFFLYLPWLKITIDTFILGTNEGFWLKRPGVNYIIETFKIYSGSRISFPTYSTNETFDILFWVSIFFCLIAILPIKFELYNYKKIKIIRPKFLNKNHLDTNSSNQYKKLLNTFTYYLI